MIATNHALTGALIGLTVHNPLIALPAAIASHLICDAIPHYGRQAEDAITTRGFAIYLVVDAFFCGVLVLVLALSNAAYWPLAAVCAFLAASPDFLSIPKFVAARRGQIFTPNQLETFLKNIQWFERPIGAFVEAAWLVGAVALLSVII